VLSNETVYRKLQEGLGGCYERIAYSNVIKDIMKRYDCHSMLELNATYIAGVPAFNSIIFAQEGYDVTITVKDRDYEDGIQAWALTGQKANIFRWNDDCHTPFKDNEFDIVWNHLAIDQYKDPLPLVQEMARISKKLVLNLTLTPYNYGFVIHRLMHLARRKPYDHGYMRNALIPTVKRIHREAGLLPIASGGTDCPPWMDTVDEHFGGSMTYIDHYPKGIRDNWIWCSANPACRNHWLTRMFWNWEKSMPKWFVTLMSHHLYVASIKN